MGVVVVAVGVVVNKKHWDRYGIGWRDEYAIDILLHHDKIDIIEVIAENFLTSPLKISSLQTLSAQIPITLHSVSLGIASSLPINIKRVEKLAYLFDVFSPVSWSEHFAFCRANEYEIGHLAAPPWNDETIEGTISNLKTIKEIIGMTPHLENIATLIQPVYSQYDEWTWITRILEATSCGLLLDLHNLYANCINFNYCPRKILSILPLHYVKYVHLSGGKWINDPYNKNKRYLLDDHLHDVPEEVFELLTYFTTLCYHSLTIIIERDGHYPNFNIILNQINRAKQAVLLGRKHQTERDKSHEEYVY